MPRVSREQTDMNRAAIEAVSARLFREQGLNGVSVADLMSAAGLTHGGFYGHFESKDALAAVACEHAFDQAAKQRAKRLKNRKDGQSALKTYADCYLSSGHRDNAGRGCPTVAFAGDVAREPHDKPVRTAYLTGVKEMADAIESMSKDRDMHASRDQALVQMATLVGAVILARATKGDAISNDILAAVRGFFADLPAS